MKKTFKCEYCGKQLSTKWNLKIHYKTCIRDETQEKGTKSEKQDNKHLGGYFSHQGYKWTKHKQCKSESNQCILYKDKKNIEIKNPKTKLN